jgi:hypothetical protein
MDEAFHPTSSPFTREKYNASTQTDVDTIQWNAMEVYKTCMEQAINSEIVLDDRIADLAKQVKEMQDNWFLESISLREMQDELTKYARKIRQFDEDVRNAEDKLQSHIEMINEKLVGMQKIDKYLLVRERYMRSMTETMIAKMNEINEKGRKSQVHQKLLAKLSVALEERRKQLFPKTKLVVKVPELKPIEPFDSEIMDLQKALEKICNDRVEMDKLTDHKGDQLKLLYYNTSKHGEELVSGEWKESIEKLFESSKPWKPSDFLTDAEVKDRFNGPSQIVRMCKKLQSSYDYSPPEDPTIASARVVIEDNGSEDNGSDDEDLFECEDERDTKKSRIGPQAHENEQNGAKETKKKIKTKSNTKPNTKTHTETNPKTADLRKRRTQPSPTPHLPNTQKTTQQPPANRPDWLHCKIPGCTACANVGGICTPNPGAAGGPRTFFGITL